MNRNAQRRSGWLWSSATPVLTYALIAINVAVFALQKASGDLTERLTLWPAAVADGQIYRLVTSAFSHYGLTHLLLNMWALYVVGPPLERWLGRLQFGALYALSALGGSVLVYLLSPLNAATAGASGALFGLFGATFVVSKRLSLDLRWSAALIGINLIFTFVVPAISSMAISWQAHVGGLVTGALIALGYVYAPRKRRNLIQAEVAVAVVMLFTVLIFWRTSDLPVVVPDTRYAFPAGDSAHAPTISQEVTPVAMDALEGLLLSPGQINTAMGASEMTLTAMPNALAEDSAYVSDKACLPLAGAGEASAYAGSGWSALRGREFREPGDFSYVTHLVGQYVVLFSSAHDADAFFTASAQSWPACSGRQYTATGAGTVWDVGPVSNINGTLTATLTGDGVKGWACQRALATANNVAIDVRACSYTQSDSAVNIVQQIAAKVPS
jgi:membrane associated rhomboid family serine protease